MGPSRILAVEHVHLEAPFGREDELRWFYGQVAKLEELAAGEGSFPLRFRSEAIELRIQLLQAPRIDPIAVRVTIAVPALAAACELLEERRIEYQRVTGITHTDRRMQVPDPAGNLVELKQDWSLLPF
jgi:hypothetical protein